MSRHSAARARSAACHLAQVALSVLLLAAFGACAPSAPYPSHFGDNSKPDDKDPADDDNEEDPDSSRLAACDEAPSRSISEGCCPDFGIDACGAGLFCAAFDGRTVPTCYPDHIRADGESCAADQHCASGGCAAAGVCQSSPHQPCTADVGCRNPFSPDEVWQCSSETDVCVRGAREHGAACDEDALCASGVCVAGSCAERSGVHGPCDDSTDCEGMLSCLGGYCQPASVGGGCQSDGDCTYGCLEGACVEQERGAACDSDNDCSDWNDTCVDSVCTWACTNDWHCAFGGGNGSYECRSNQCVALGENGDVCQSEDDCKASLTCADSVCRADAGARCDSGDECASGVCEAVSVQRCRYLLTGEYGSACADNDDCPSTENVPQACSSTTEDRCE